MFKTDVFCRIYEKIFLFTSEITTVEDSTKITCDAIFFYGARQTGTPHKSKILSNHTKIDKTFTICKITGIMNIILEDLI